jgi:anti-sigma-K factor RskA
MTGDRTPRAGDHETWDELAVGWALHALEPEDEAVFTRHLPDCARCARTVAETSEVMGSLAADLPPAEPSEELRQRLRAAVEQTEQVRRPVLPLDQPTDYLDEAPRPERRAPVPSRTPRVDPVALPAPSSSDPRPLWRRRMPQLLVAAAAAVILGLGAWNVVVSTSRQDAQTAAAQERQMINELLTPGQATIAPVSDPHGQVMATVVARRGQVQVVSWDLPKNDAQTHTYVVWGMRGTSPVALGTFDVVSTQTDLRTVGSPQAGIDGFDAFAVSLEPGRKAPSTPTDVVAYGQVTS